MRSSSVRLWFYLLLLVLGFIAAYMLIVMWKAPHVELPELESMEQLEETTREEPLPPPSPELKISFPLREEHVEGDLNAPLSLIAFFSFQDEYSEFAYEAINKFLIQNPDTTNMVFRHYPLEEDFPLSPTAALASECVHDMGGDRAFWAFTDKLFSEDFSEEDLELWAEEMGLDMEKYDQCVREKWYAEQVRTKMIEGWQWGMRSIPSIFFVRWDTGEGRMVIGAHGVEYLQMLHDEMME